MSVDAAPTINVGAVLGGDVPTGPAAAPLVAVDALSITWGRGSVLEQTTPATATVRVLDRTPGAVLASRSDLIGAPLQLGYRPTETPSSSVTNFYGRITDVDVAPHPAGGFVVSLAGSSREVDTGNYRVAEGLTAWPAESFGTRLGRLRTLLRSGLLATPQITMPLRADAGVTDPVDPAQDLDTVTAAPVNPSGQDLLSLIRQFWASVSPLPLVYRPDHNDLSFAPRRRYDHTVQTGYAVTAALVSSPAHGGRYVVQAVNGLDLDAGVLPYGGGISWPQDSRITQIEVSYLDGANGYADATATASTPDAALEGSIGRRTLTVSTWHGTATYAAQLAGMWSSLIANEGRAARLGSLTYRSDLAGGFDTAAHRAALLAGYERADTFFVGGSWLPQLGIRPLVGIVGGTISYAAGSWSLLLTPAPVAVTDATSPVTVATAARSTVTLADLDDSVTFGDARYVEVGAGYTTATQPPWGGPPS